MAESVIIIGAGMDATFKARAEMDLRARCF
jgi:hypothetical protein